MWIEAGKKKTQQPAESSIERIILLLVQDKEQLPSSVIEFAQAHFF